MHRSDLGWRIPLSTAVLGDLLRALWVYITGALPRVAPTGANKTCLQPFATRLRRTHAVIHDPQLSYGTEKEHRFFPHQVGETWEDYAVQFTMRSPTALAPKYGHGPEIETARSCGGAAHASWSAATGDWLAGFDFTPGYLSKSAQDRKLIAQARYLGLISGQECPICLHVPAERRSPR